MMLIILNFFITLCQANSRFLGRANPLPRPVKTVYLIPHSHDDVGWLDTVDGVYNYNPGVKNIITSYVNALSANKKRKFVQVETYYFKRWYNEQDARTKDKVKTLIENGQLSFACAGWVMNDEATAYYEDVIDQLTDGHKFLFDEFGFVNKVGWQIDPFGHSAAQTKFDFLMGYDAQFFNRIDYREKEERKQNKSLELLLLAQDQSYLFTHILYNHYSSPPGLDIDPFHWGHESPVQETQIRQKAESLVQYFEKVFRAYQGTIIAHTLGDDSEFSQANAYFENTEKIIDFINSRQNDYQLEIIFGTPYDYIKAKNKEELNFTLKSDDFYPYADKSTAFWTGYFTSRPAFKKLIRTSGRYYQQFRTFFSSAMIEQNNSTFNKMVQLALRNMSETLGIMQHHDAVTGTAKESVTNNYVALILQSLNLTNTLLHSYVIDHYLKHFDGNIKELFQYDWNTSAKHCKQIYENLNNGSAVLMTVLDQKDWRRNQILSVRVPKKHYLVLNQKNGKVSGDLICSRSEDDCTIYFLHERMGRLTYYLIVPAGEASASIKTVQQEPYSVGEDGLIKIDDGPQFEIDYRFYEGTQMGQASGAYIFRPQDGSIKYGSHNGSFIYRGSLLSEIVLNKTVIVSRIRKYKHMANQYEIETFVDSIKQSGRDIVMLIKTDIQNDQVFYTDSNGMDLQRRKLNYRETWNFSVDTPISENYYPIDSMIMINSSTSNVTLLNDRSQGGTSLKNGELEIMLHRRASRDDQRGVGETLNEHEDDPDCLTNCTFTIPLRQYLIHRLVFNENAREVQLEHDFAPLKLFGLTQKVDFPSSFESPREVAPLDQIKILDSNGEDQKISKLYVIPWDYQKLYLVRLQNMQDKEVSYIKWPSSVKVRETTLNGLQEAPKWIESRLKWATTEEIVPLVRDRNELQPMQIRTYLLSVQQ